jgi:hypothetical protein
VFAGGCHATALAAAKRRTAKTCRSGQQAGYTWFLKSSDKEETFRLSPNSPAAVGGVVAIIFIGLGLLLAF